jgi:hypothetical protein
MSEEKRAEHARKQRERWAAKKAAAEATLAPFNPMQIPNVVEEVPVETIVTPWDREDAGPEMVEDEPPPVAEPVSRYDVFLASLSDETRELLEDAELRAVFAASEKKAKDERRAQLQKQAAEKALSMARADAGLVPKEQAEVHALRERNSRKVKWQVNLPFVGDTGGTADEGLKIDGRTFYHGQEVTTTYAEWLSCREMLYRLRQHEMDFEGKGRLHHLRRNISEFGMDSMMRAL